jgi:hypothetical protein
MGEAEVVASTVHAYSLQLQKSRGRLDQSVHRCKASGVWLIAAVGDYLIVFLRTMDTPQDVSSSARTMLGTGFLEINRHSSSGTTHHASLASAESIRSQSLSSSCSFSSPRSRVSGFPIPFPAPCPPAEPGYASSIKSYYFASRCSASRQPDLASSSLVCSFCIRDSESSVVIGSWGVVLQPSKSPSWELGLPVKMEVPAEESVKMPVRDEETPLLEAGWAEVSLWVDIIGFGGLGWTSSCVSRLLTEVVGKAWIG